MKAPAALMMFVLNAPHSPLSAVTTISRIFASGFGSGSINKG